ncbi:MAG: MlaD family protein [Candidatus Omnitrophica bacterium]|nr:MlaD family protein [Candidatus Omnitrophota bacterium]MCM8801983.1 MlaD family protein [Candidatus Omnitrophota bacterium]
MDKKVTTELKVGTLVFAAILGIIIFIFTQTRVSKWTGYEVGVLFDYVSGLEIGNPVRVSGVRVGEVKKIEILYEEKPKVLVKLKINPTVKIGKNSKFTIKTLGIIGEKYIEIFPSKEKEFLKKGEIVEGEEPLSVDKIANMGEEMLVNLNEILSDIREITGDKEVKRWIKEILENSKTTIEKINNSFEKIDRLTDGLAKTNQNLNSFIEENSPTIKKVIEDADLFLLSSKKEIEDTMRDVRNFLTLKDKAEILLSSFTDTSYEITIASLEFKKASLQIREFFEKIEKEGLIAKIMKEEQMIDDIKKEIEILKETTAKIGNVSEKLSSTLENLNTILIDLKTSKGSIGKLLYSDELYNEVLNFIKEIRENPWKLFFRKR